MRIVTTASPVCSATSLMGSDLTGREASHPIRRRGRSGFRTGGRADLSWTSAVKLRSRTPEPRIAHATIADPEQHTVMDDGGPVRSIQAANLDMPQAELDGIWT